MLSSGAGPARSPPVRPSELTPPSRSTGTIVLNVEIESRDDHVFRVDPAWRIDGPPPIDAYIDLVGHQGPIEGSFTNSVDRRVFHFQKWLQAIDCQRLAGAKLNIKVHPLDLHLAISLGPA